MKRVRNIIISLATIAILATSPVFATQVSTVDNTSNDNIVADDLEKELVSNIRNSNAEQLSMNNKTIYRVDDKQKFISFSETSKNDIEDYDVYIIEDESDSQSIIKSKTIVTDIKFNKNFYNKIGIVPTASGGTKYNEDNCGRTTGYVKIWYTQKNFSGDSGIKVTQIGGKMTYVPSGVVLRNLELEYRSLGVYFTSTGQTKAGRLIKNYPLSRSSAFSLQTKSTNDINRYYLNSISGGQVGGVLIVTYGGTTASSQATYEIHVNACNLSPVDLIL